jgi:hypothetical protein
MTTAKNVIQQAAYQDFDRAQRRAFVRGVISYLLRRDNRLIPLEEVKQFLPFRGRRDIGIKIVAISQIVGSSNRYNDFDRAFMPLHKRSPDRWINIHQARAEAIGLPPVDLYKIGDVYFVEDGHHRISVARLDGQLEIEARVIEIDVEVPLNTPTDIKRYIAECKAGIVAVEINALEQPAAPI